MMLHIGLDDTDSPEGGCTTYVAAVLVEHLIGIGAEFSGYPTLLRLNPNTPWKTRGNAAVCLRLKIDESKYQVVREFVKGLVDKYGELSCENTNPGVVFLKGDVPDEIKAYSDVVVKSLVEKKMATDLIEAHSLDHLEYKNGRGLIGALAAIGGTLERDFTYELLTYRTPENWGTPRKVDQDSIIKMDEALSECTYNNLDEKGKPMILPRGPDPVLYGVRGETPEDIHNAMGMIEPLEDVERWMICKTNQGTDQHFGNAIKISELEPYNPAVVEGRVASKPKTIEGGHVFFQIKDESGAVDCAAYEPTGSFRNDVRKLLPGDQVTIFSGVSLHEDELTLNIEKLVLHELVPKISVIKPKCPECGGSTGSMGAGQGLRCKKCGYRGDELVEELVEQERELKPGIYLPDMGAHRHLTKPYPRYGREKAIELIIDE
jgi:tRNA(Ile2)-agmatinylcytidine synthase